MMSTCDEEIQETELVASDLEFLTFECDGQIYGVDILRVEEIRGWDQVTRVPNVPGHVRGVLNLRGTIVPIVDLRLRFGLSFEQYSRTTVIIVVQVHSEEKSRVMGLVVDAVSDVCVFSTEQMQEPPDMGSSMASRHISNMATYDDDLIILLDVDYLLNECLSDDPEVCDRVVN